MASKTKKIAEIRREYQQGKMNYQDLPGNPFELFKKWLDDAIESEIVYEPTAMVLSSVGKNGMPSSRVVLLKELNEQGQVTFFTNYDSRKGTELAQNPGASILFFWPELERQVRLEGKVTKTSSMVSDEYFKSRPRESRIAASVSPQSKEIVNKDFLTRSFLEAVEKFRDKESIPRPGNWGGFVLNPTYLEFWQGGQNRLHDRVAYRSTGKGWQKVLLAP